LDSPSARARATYPQETFVIGRTFALAAAALIAVACERPASERRARGGPIHREIFVVGDTIRLGQRWPGAARSRAAPGDTVVQLRPGTFGGASAIAVHLAAGDTVKAISFEYAPGANYEAMVADYTEFLGKPARRFRIAAPGPGPAEITAWEDARTTLQLMRGEVGGVSRVASALFDRGP